MIFYGETAISGAAGVIPGPPGRSANRDPILAEASIDAVKKWKYRPYLLNGEPVEVATTIKIQLLNGD